MQSLYRKILTTTWPRPLPRSATRPEASLGFSVTNNFDIPIYISLMSAPTLKVGVTPGAVGQLSSTADDTCIVQAAQTGSFMCAIPLVSSILAVTVDYTLLTDPNDIGPVPQPTSQMLVPPDSARILVGCSRLANGNTVIREQFWDRQADSLTLSPGETKTITTTVTTGRQETSTHESTLAASVGMNASVGFGPFSASVSSSLSMTSRTFQQVTVSEQNTAYYSDVLTNPYTDQDCLVLRWQLTDVITIFDASGPALGSVIIGESPIITQTYGINDLPSAPSLFALTDDDRQLR